MDACVTEAIDRLEALLQKQAAVIRRPDHWPAAYGHAPWVIEVWVNFISNAAKYGGAKPVITLGARPGEDGANARFWVQDSGLGLDPAAQQQMFVPFTRISSIRAKGHGLGLSIVRRIVEKLVGQVGVDSESGAGACFWFELPTRAPLAKPVDPMAPPLLFVP
jgi:signal transduction histidine kinase